MAESPPAGWGPLDTEAKKLAAGDRLLAELWRMVERSHAYWNREDRDDFLAPDLHYRYELVKQSLRGDPPYPHLDLLLCLSDFLEHVPDEMKAASRPATG